ncbi:MAG: NAD(P)-binding domain-containing protein [Spirochaetota bacterium]|nr:MAG: NAD(P)-binding domain-containing protein [Spirochaetota bacterium]
MKSIALLGAGGKIGCRITDNLKNSDYNVRYVEISSQGIANLKERGITVTPLKEAIKDTDVVILALPDKLLGDIAHEIVPQLKPGNLVITLDPAAAYGGELPERKDIAYFVTHPCHPPVINDETDLEAKKDFYGGKRAKQNIVCALIQGSEEDYKLGENISRFIFSPVMNAHRITLEQMAILEPAMAETVVLTLMFTMKEAMDEAVSAGVPEAAAKDFLFGHININLGILFNIFPARFSDGALKAVERAKGKLLQPDWKKVFKKENIKKEVKAITGGR